MATSMGISTRRVRVALGDSRVVTRLRLRQQVTSIQKRYGNQHGHQHTPSAGRTWGQ
jgi:hypothetical protein